MKRCVEASNLRQQWRVFRDRSNGSQVVRLMQGRQWHKRFQFGEDTLVYADWLEDFCTAMHDTMASRGQTKLARLAALAPIE
jgi:hypothetical protein